MKIRTFFPNHLIQFIEGVVKMRRKSGYIKRQFLWIAPAMLSMLFILTLPNQSQTKPNPCQIAIATEFGIRLINLETGMLTTLTESFSLPPVWSPDGTQIATVEESGKLYVVTIADKSKRLLAEDAYYFELPVWSPDGKSIAYTIRSNERYRIYLFDLNTDTSHQLGNDLLGSITDPDWSPQGDRIAYTQTFWGINTIGVIDLLSGSNDALTVGSKPKWSPDGSQIVYQHDGDIYVYSVDTHSNRNVTNNDSTTYINPVWSPDGSQIAFVSTHNGDREIYIFDVVAASSSQLPSIEVTSGFPAWSPDGSQIAFVSGYETLVVIALSNYNSISFAVDPFGGPAWSPLCNND